MDEINSKYDILEFNKILNKRYSEFIYNKNK